MQVSIDIRYLSALQTIRLPYRKYIFIDKIASLIVQVSPRSLLMIYTWYKLFRERDDFHFAKIIEHRIIQKSH